jgi:nucleoside-diphosphate-sugar epimerase
VGKLVHTSTSETYGTAIYTPIDEKHPLHGQSPYSASKIAADKLVESFVLSFGVQATTIRPFNTFGPRQSARAVVPTIISQLLSDSEEVHLGSLQPVRDFCYVKDTVNAFVMSMNCPDNIGRVINIGTGTAVTIGDVVKLLQDIEGVRKKIVVDEERVRPEKSEVMKLICDNTLAKKVLNWGPKFNLEQGLRETVEYIRGNIGYLKTKVYNL